MIGIVLVSLAGILSGTITFGGKVLSQLGISLFEISIYRYSIAALLILPFIRKSLPLLLVKWKPLLLLGFVGASLGLTEVAAVITGAPVSLVAFLLYTQPLWTVFLSAMILGEKPTMRKIIALGIALIGVIVLFEPWSIEGGEYLPGFILGLAGGLLLSLYFVLIRKTHFDQIPPLLGTFGWLICSVLWFFVFYPFVSFFVHDPSFTALRINLPLTSWMFLLLFSMTAEALPGAAFFYGSRTVQASLSGIIMLLEPVSAAILSVIFLSEAVTINIMMGGIIILFANAVAICGSDTNPHPPDPQAK